MVQGLDAAMASATGLSILVAAFPEGKERNRVLGVYAAASGSGFAATQESKGVIRVEYLPKGSPGLCC